MNIIDKLKKWQAQGEFTALKWVLLFCLLGVVIGGFCGAIKVIYFEQTEGGFFAVHEECVSHYPNGDCKFKENVIDSSGDRVKELVKLGSFYGLMFGFTIGAFVSTGKYNIKHREWEKKEKEKMEDDWRKNNKWAPRK